MMLFCTPEVTAWTVGVWVGASAVGWCLGGLSIKLFEKAKKRREAPASTAPLAIDAEVLDLMPLQVAPGTVPLTCPFCGDGNIHIAYDVDARGSFVRYECKSCEAQGPVALRWDMALAYWNRRTEPLVNDHRDARIAPLV